MQHESSPPRHESFPQPQVNLETFSGMKAGTKLKLKNEKAGTTRAERRHFRFNV